MRHRHRPARFDLFAENRHHAAAAAKDVAEAHSDKSRAALGAVERLNVNFRATLGRSHHAGGIDRLVRRDHHKRRRSGADRFIGDGFGSQDVVLDRLAGVKLHHGDVLMSRTVEHHLRLFRREDRRDPPGIDDVGNIRSDIRPHPAVIQLAVNFKQGVLRLIQQDEPARAEFQALAADLRPDASAGAGNEDALAGQKAL